MLCFPNCKINLGLYVTRRREDGYHDLETVFFPVNFHDSLEVVPAMETSLHLSGLKVGSNTQENLVWKAYEMLSARYPGKVPPLNIFLHKAIPMGAGLGGGSADGAFMLRLLNDFCNLGIDKPTLAAMALELGSDCPFFIYNTPQMATGRGEVMNPIAIDLAGYSLQLICPKVHVSTRDAFGMMTPREAPFDLRHLGTLPVERWKGSVSNDFEHTVFKVHPVLADIKQQLYDQGAIYASMSGSGSTMFGIFRKGQRAQITADVAFKDVYIEQATM